MGNFLSRRRLLQLAGAATLPLSSNLEGGTAQAAAGTLTIAYNVNLPSFDPTVGLSAVNPTIQSIYQSIFDPYVSQAPDLSFKPGLLTKWGWNDDKTKIMLEVRKDAMWHDGTPVTPDDVVWSLQRAADPKSGNPIQFVWSKIGNYKIDGATITGDVLEFERLCSSGWPFSPATCCRKPIIKRWVPKGLRRHRSAPALIKSKRLSGTRFCD